MVFQDGLNAVDTEFEIKDIIEVNNDMNTEFEIKDILEKHQSKHNDQIIENTIKTERTELKMSETLELVNVIRENFETFNRQSDRLDFKMID